MVTDLVAKVTSDRRETEQAEHEASPMEPVAMEPHERWQTRQGEAASASEPEAPLPATTPPGDLAEAPEPPLPGPAMPTLANMEATPSTHQIANASLLCLTARPPGNHARDIILVDYNGKVQQRLVADGALNLSPILSPGQRRLAYTSYRERVRPQFMCAICRATKTSVSRCAAVLLCPAPGRRTAGIWR